MMKSTNLLYAKTSALPAIAAALALSSTPLLAQEVPQAQPTTTTTEPSTTAPSTPTTTAPDELATPPTDSSTAATPDADTTAQTSSTTTRSVHRTTHAAAAKPRPASTAKAMPRTETTHTAAATPIPAAVRPTRSSHVNPVVDLSPQPPAERSTTAAATKPARKKDAALPIAGGALAFLAIGGAAVAMTRRRGENE